MMNEQDSEYLEKLYAGLAMVGFLMNGDYSPEEIPTRSKALAKAMMEEDIDDGGIATIKKRKYVRKD
jgi:hypothetical protein